MTCYFGIDPGGSGAMACLSESSELEVIPLTRQIKGKAVPLSEAEILAWLRDRVSPTNDFAVIERVSGYMPGEKKVSKSTGKEFQVGVAPGSAMFSFGQSYGALRMALAASGLTENESWVAIRPQIWQRGIDEYLKSRRPSLGLALPPRSRKSGESRDDFKRRLKGIAESLFPESRAMMTLKTADAALIAVYCREKFSKTSNGRTLWG
jgi:hypothetical protein